MGKLSRAAIYRLFRKEKRGILLDTLSTCTEVKTLYIFEGVAEFMSAWLGPTAYIPSNFWIRNWKNKMVEHISWDRRFEFYDWFQKIEFLTVEELQLNKKHIRQLRKSIEMRASKMRRNERSAAIHIRIGDFRRISWGVLADNWNQRAVLEFVDKRVRSIDCSSDESSEARQIL